MKTISIALFILSFCVPSSVFAAFTTNAIIVAPSQVYSKPSINAKRVRKIKKGTKAKISTSPRKNGFHRILFLNSGKKIKGYVARDSFEFENTPQKKSVDTQKRDLKAITYLPAVGDFLLTSSTTALNMTIGIANSTLETTIGSRTVNFELTHSLSNNLALSYHLGYLLPRIYRSFKSDNGTSISPIKY